MGGESTTTALGGRLLDMTLRDQIARVHADTVLDAGGGASLVKVLTLADFIVGNQLRTIVEIGVYRGRLLLPLGSLLTALGEGIAIGIDPYSQSAAMQNDAHGRETDLVAFPATVDWESLHDHVSAEIERWGIAGHTRLERARSHDAASGFDPGSIDLLHVDGNHDAAAVAQDLNDYLPAVRPGGFVVLDDISWRSVLPHYARLAAQHELLFALSDLGAPLEAIGGNDFAVFRLGAR